MNAKHHIYAPILLLTALVLVSCSSQNKIATNYYADGIYFDPEYSKVVLATANELPETSSVVEEGFDYYEPGTYNSPYEQEVPGGWSGGSSYNSMYNPMGWGSAIGMGNTWGSSYYPYGDMNPNGGMFPSFYNPYAFSPFMFNPYMYNPYMYNPYCNFNGFYGGGYGMYNPYWGYPGYGYYPDNGSGNTFHDFYSGNQPDVLIRSGSAPRPTRNSMGTSNRGGTSNPTKGGRVTQTPGSTTTGTTTTASERMANTQKTTSAQRLRSQVSQQRQRTYASEAATPKTDARAGGEARQLYEKTTRTENANRTGADAATASTPARNTAGSTTTNGNSKFRNSNLERQTQRVIENTTNKPTQTRTYTPQTRTYTPRSTNENQAAPTRTAPNSGGGNSRPSGGGGSSGGSRPSGGGGGSTTIRR